MNISLAAKQRLAADPELSQWAERIKAANKANLASAIHWRRECKKIERTCREAVERREQLRELCMQYEHQLENRGAP